ncbi:transposase family protein [Streptomyces sp. cg40]|uniref:transposase family protein n=1 Tax=Streptomyces sp. cg40 TaxID=3419764 RepID=UPI003D06E49E
MAGVITASESSWIVPFTGLSPRQFGKLITALRREGADPVRKGRPWSLPLEDRVLLVAAYWRTNLTLRQLAPLFEVSKSAADRIIDHLGPALALQQRKRFRKDAVGKTTVIADGGYRGTGLVIPHRREPGQAELPDWKEEHNASHRKVRARVEHAFARMKTWKILRDCRLKGDGVHHAMLGIARLHNLTLAG